MEIRSAIRNFIAAFIGVGLYKLFFEISDPFAGYWSNFLLEAALIGGCILVVMILLNYLAGDHSRPDSKSQQ